MEWIVTGLSFYNDFLVLQWFRADPRVRPTPLGGPLQAISDGQAKVRPTSAGGGKILLLWLLVLILLLLFGVCGSAGGQRLSHVQR